MDIALGSECTSDLATTEQEFRCWMDSNITDEGTTDWPKSWASTNANQASSADHKIEESDAKYLFLAVREFPTSFVIGNGPPPNDKVYVYMVHNGNVLLVHKDILFTEAAIPRQKTTLAEFKGNIERMHGGQVTVRIYLEGEGFKYPMNQDSRYGHFEELCLQKLNYHPSVPTMNEIEVVSTHISLMDLDTFVAPKQEKQEQKKPEPITPVYLRGILRE